MTEKFSGEIKTLADLTLAVEGVLIQLFNWEFESEVSPEELSQLEEDALLRYLNELQVEIRDLGALEARIGAVHTWCKAQMSAFKESKSCIQSILRALRDR